MKKNFIYILIITIISSCAPSQRLSLSLNLQEDDKFIVRMSQLNEMDMNIMGTSQASTQSQIIDYQYIIASKDGKGNTNFQTTIKDIEIFEKSPQGTVEFNSRESGDVALDDLKTRMYQKMLGQSLYFTLDSKGDIIKLTGMDEMFEAVFDDQAFKDNPMIEPMKDLMIQQLGNEAFKESFSMFVNFYPPKPVEIGDSWTKSDTLFRNIGIITNSTYTLKKRDKGKAFIAVNATITPNLEAEGLDLGVMKIQYNLNGTQTGNITVDEQTGWATGINVKQNLTGTLKMSGASLPSEIESDVDMKGVYSFERLK